MARTVVTTQVVTIDGLDVQLTAPAVDPDGDAIDSGNVHLVVDNADAVSHDITIQTPLQVEGLDVEDPVRTIPAGGRRTYGPFPRNVYGQPASAQESGASDGGKVYIDYGADVTGITRGVVSL